jgi:hypothetical protein
MSAVNPLLLREVSMIRIGRPVLAAILLAAGALLLGSAPAGASTRPGGNIYDGEYMAMICSSNADTHRSTCTAYVVTVAHAMSYNRIEGFRACVPNFSGTWAGLTASVVQWLERNRDSWGLSTVGVIAAALSESYPCRE